ncbi:hypothetical protein [Actibacterium ureilyticum]|uniref:hypothetical protein n=1 Tax=Actibacterium ureilyticum TaxID=1590614 RepID=UPI001FECEACD|nr:hypothetical protein [Actibacterium ureilyticum]
MTALLASCGADGEPTRPSVNAGVGIDSNGNLRTGASLGTRIGPVGVSVGL